MATDYEYEVIDNADGGVFTDSFVTRWGPEDIEYAALEFAERYDQDDYPLLHGDEPVFTFVHKVTGKRESYQLFAEPSVDYRVRKV